MNERVWRTKEGSLIPVQDMTANHLRNAIAMLERRGGNLLVEMDAIYTTACRGDGAQYEQECAASDNGIEIRRNHSWIMCLKSELARRDSDDG